MLVCLVVMTSVNLVVNTLAFSSGHAFIHAEDRAGKQKTENGKTAPQDDNSYLAELYLGFVKNNSQEN